MASSQFGPPFVNVAPNYGLAAHTFNIKGGSTGILETVRAMRGLVEQFKTDPEIRQLVLNLVSFLPQKDHESEVNSVFMFVRDQIRYVQDINGIETLSTPTHTLIIGQGDCDDKATLLATMLETIGIPCMFILASYSSSKQFEHVYCMAQLPDGELIALDPTEPDDMGFQPEGATNLLAVY